MLDILPRPPQSPDLNIIESMREALQQELWTRRDSLMNADEVWAKAREIFHNFILTFIRNFMDLSPIG